MLMKAWKILSACCMGLPPRPCSIPPWGCAISTMLPVGQASVTLDLKLTYLRPLSVKSGTIQAEGKLIKLGRQTSYTEGFVRDGAGKLAVHATATFSMLGAPEKAK